MAHRPDQAPLMLRIRDLALTVVDAFTREALAIDVDQGIKGEQVVATMTWIMLSRGAPTTIRVDNGPEFISKALQDRGHMNAGNPPSNWMRNRGTLTRTFCDGRWTHLGMNALSCGDAFGLNIPR